MLLTMVEPLLYSMQDEQIREYLVKAQEFISELLNMEVDANVEDECKERSL